MWGSMREIDKEKAYNTVALKYYELEELRKIRTDLITMEQDCKAKVTVKTIQSTPYSKLLRYRTKKKTFDIAPKLLLQIIDKVIVTCPNEVALSFLFL